MFLVNSANRRIPVAHQASSQLPAYYQSTPDPDRGATTKIVALLLGIALPAVLGFALWAAISAQKARDDAHKLSTGAPAATAPASMPGMTNDTSTAAGALPTPSYAGLAPENADAIAAAHKPYPAAMPATQPGAVATVHLTLKDVVHEVAPGIKYNAWAFSGGAPGPVVHVRQGQTVKMTLTNGGAIPHSIDFHAARIAPNVAFRDVAPGESFTFSFKAGDPGVYMYHCGTKPVLMHIANGMYGAIVVDPATPLPKADREYVLVSSEWYLNAPGLKAPATFDMAKAHTMAPDWVTWNGYAGQYVKHPLTANPGETVRFYVVAAGPSFDTDFHVVGTLLDRAWVDADMTQYLRNVQTATVPAGGGGVFDVKIDKPGLYPFVSHSFASVDMGQVGLLKVGNVPGTMSH
jgi:nitrite reductase (NO-forming)